MHKLRMKAPFLAALGALLLVAVVNKRTPDEWTPPDRAVEIQQKKQAAASSKQVEASESDARSRTADAPNR